MKNKPLCVIVDDEEMGLANLRSSIEELNLLEIESAYLDPDKFLVEIDQLESKIIFLDMEMPISGIEVASKLKDKLVIFVSGYVERGYQTFEVNAIDFVPKPIRNSRLKVAIHKALTAIVPKMVVLKTQDAKREEVDPALIAFVKTADDSRDKKIHLSNGKVILAKNIKFDKVLALLPSYFLQVNPQYVVNVNFVNKRLDNDTIGLDLPNNSEVVYMTLGKSYQKAFFSHKPQLK
jgi:DNA-binding LytR/AlgR family response regulator